MCREVKTRVNDKSAFAVTSPCSALLFNSLLLSFVFFLLVFGFFLLVSMPFLNYEQYMCATQQLKVLKDDMSDE